MLFFCLMIIEYRHLPSTSFLKQAWAGGVCSIGEDLQAVHLSHFLAPCRSLFQAALPCHEWGYLKQGSRKKLCHKGRQIVGYDALRLSGKIAGESRTGHPRLVSQGKSLQFKWSLCLRQSQSFNNLREWSFKLKRTLFVLHRFDRIRKTALLWRCCRKNLISCVTKCYAKLRKTLCLTEGLLTPRSQHLATQLKLATWSLHDLNLQQMLLYLPQSLSSVPTFLVI